jgi:hypothetical protein
MIKSTTGVPERDCPDCRCVAWITHYITGQRIVAARYGKKCLFLRCPKHRRQDQRRRRWERRAAQRKPLRRKNARTSHRRKAAPKRR